MINGILIALLFLTSALIQVSFIQIFSSPIGLFPLHFLIGVVILQRAGSTDGILWFMASAFVLNLLGLHDASWIAYILAGATGLLLTRRAFTSHSVYGLEGLAISMYLVFFIINSLFGSSQSANELLIDFLVSSGELIIGIYFAFLIANAISKFSNNLLITRKNKRFI